MSTGGTPGRLETWVERDDRLVVIGVAGEVDIETAEQFASSLRGAPTGDEIVVVDLRGVPFIDSSGLKALLVAGSELGSRLALALSPGSPVATLLDLARVSDRFAIYETPDAAVAALTGGQG
jgi:stage II sporulation protein AA (anti-sigma F factor antagonist)